MKSTRSIHFILLVSCTVLTLFSTSCSTSRETVEGGSTGYRIVGYVRGTPRLDLRLIDAAKLTHINYAFANLIGNELVLDSVRDAAHFAQLNALKAKNPHLKLLVSVGGWGWSDYFSDAALSDTSREYFARSAITALKRYGLDGIDLDWEYPGQLGEDNIYRAVDRENFTLMLKTLREHLDAQGKRDGRTGHDRYLLTIAGAANSTYLEHTDLKTAHQYLDFINLMTYDYHGPWTEKTGHHTNLYASDDRSFISSKEGVDLYLKKGIPPEKLVLGVAFYGRGWKGVVPTDNGLYQPYSGAASAYSYSALSDRFIDRNGYRRYWDDAAKAPYLWHADSTIFITYEDEISLEYKTNFVKDMGLGGVMYWEHSHDPDERLLDVLYRTLNRPE